MDRFTAASAAFLVLLSILSSAVARTGPASEIKALTLCKEGAEPAGGDCDATSLLSHKHQLHQRGQEVPNNEEASLEEEGDETDEEENEDEEEEAGPDEEEASHEDEDEEEGSDEEEHDDEEEEDEDEEVGGYAESSLLKAPMLLAIKHELHKDGSAANTAKPDSTGILQKLEKGNAQPGILQKLQKGNAQPGVAPKREGPLQTAIGQAQSGVVGNKVGSPQTVGKRVDKKLSVHKKQLSKIVSGTQLTAILHESLKQIAKVAGKLKDSFKSYDKSMPDRITGSERERATVLEKEVVNAVGRFLIPWDAMMGMYKKQVGDLMNYLISEDEDSSGETILAVMGPVLELRGSFESELEKARQCVAGFSDYSPQRIYFHLEELEEHLKTTKKEAKKYIKGLDDASGMVLSGVSAKMLPFLSATEGKKIQKTYGELDIAQKQGTQDLLKALDVMVSGIQKGKDKAMPSGQKSKGHRSSALVALGAIAVAVGFVG